MRGGSKSAGTGFTLLEVILALAILGLAMATLGHAVRMSHQQAERGALETEATMVAESVLAELLSGLRPLTAVTGEPYSDVALPNQPVQTPKWKVSIEVGAGPIDGMIQVKVLVTPAEELLAGLAPVEIVRWAPDPSLAEEASAL